MTSHASFYFRCVDTLDIVTLFVFDKNASKEPYHVGSMEQHIGFLEGHALMKNSRQMINPYPVLSAHTLFISIFFLTTKQQAFCTGGWLVQ